MLDVRHAIDPHVHGSWKDGARGTNGMSNPAGHAYTLLRFVEVPLVRNKDGKEEKSILKLVHVRNPHATNEWHGPFSDNDAETWNRYPEALKATGHKIGVKDNGVFWMDFGEFSNGFTDVATCFDEQNEGARYTDNSTAAIKEHQAFGESLPKIGGLRCCVWRT